MLLSLMNLPTLYPIPIHINPYRPEDMPQFFKVDECYSDSHDGDLMRLGNARPAKNIGHRSLEIHNSA